MAYYSLEWVVRITIVISFAELRWWNGSLNLVRIV